MVSPFAAHQQQLAFMSQQQTLLMAALKAGNAPQMIPGNANQLNANGSNPPLGTLPVQNWTNLGYQNPGLTPAAAQNGATKVKRCEDARHVFLAQKYLDNIVPCVISFFVFFLFDRLQATIRTSLLVPLVLAHLGKLY